MNDKYVLVFDTETTGIPIWGIPSDDESQPHIVQLAAGLFDVETEKMVQHINLIIKPDGWEITEELTAIHGITNEFAKEVGVDEEMAVLLFLDLWNHKHIRIAHNTTFDNRLIRIAIKRFYKEANCLLEELKEKDSYECTMIESQKLMGGKRPKLEVAYKHFTCKELVGAHNAFNDMKATAELYFAIQKQKEK